MGINEREGIELAMRRRIEENYSIENCVINHEKLYKSILNH